MGRIYQERGKGHRYQDEAAAPISLLRYQDTSSFSKINLMNHIPKTSPWNNTFLSNRDQISDQIKGRLPRETVKRGNTAIILSKSKDTILISYGKFQNKKVCLLNAESRTTPTQPVRAKKGLTIWDSF